MPSVNTDPDAGGHFGRFGGKYVPEALMHALDELAHTGSHKINNVLGQCLLTRRMGKQRLIAETGAGQHGVATATAAALFGLECTVYMGAVDVERQALNVWRMKLLGAEVVPVQSGSATLKDAVNEAMRSWVASVETTHYCLGSAMGPHPFPWMVREFQRVVGDEARRQCREVLEATSISAGLDYPGVGPEHAMLAAQGRAEYHAATDEVALAGFQLLSAT